MNLILHYFRSQVSKRSAVNIPPTKISSVVSIKNFFTGVMTKLDPLIKICDVIKYFTLFYGNEITSYWKKKTFIVYKIGLWIGFAGLAQRLNFQIFVSHLLPQLFGMSCFVVQFPLTWFTAAIEWPKFWIFELEMFFCLE